MKKSKNYDLGDEDTEEPAPEDSGDDSSGDFE